MTYPFRYSAASSIADAAQQLSHAGTFSLGGGTDLLVTIDEGLARPDVLVDVRGIEGGEAIEETGDGGVRIGAMARLADVANHPAIRKRFSVLAEACDAVATPALRNMATIGGNLCQRPRCWYFRRGISCFKNGGSECPAVDGENQYLAIIDGGPCYIVHPSDPAVALTALEAVVEVASATGRRRIPMSDFYVLPAEQLDGETVLAPEELITAIVIPSESAEGIQHYHKLMQRGAWDFALASIAACKRPNGDVRLVLGGVAPRPWRVNSSVEEDVSSGGLDEDTIATLAERALYDAKPLSGNGYKVDLAASLLRQAMTELA
jgi:xanthine dehydrogenase YagS FAD-binding subunit